MLPSDILNNKIVIMKEEQYYCFLEAIVSVANIPNLAINLATTEKIEQFSPVIFACFCSKNARMCIERLAKYKKLIGPFRFNIVENNDNFAINFLPGDPSLQLPAFLVESEIIFLIDIIQKATKEKIFPVSITSIKPLSASIETFANTKVTIGNIDQIVFNSNDMKIPFISFNDDMWDYFEPELNH